MGTDIRGYVKPRPVLSFDYCSLPAYHLNGIKETVPYADADNGKGSCLKSFHISEEALSHYKSYHQSDGCRQRKSFPVTFINKDAEELSEININLS